MLIANPTIAKEWHLTKNGSFTPRGVTPNSAIKAWWICNNGHEWQAAIYSRNRGRGCPYCSGQKACADNCLATINPKLAKEWHPTKNGTLTPKEVTAKSAKKVWWICNKRHAWQAKIFSRSNGNNCPHCSGRIAKKRDSNLLRE